MRRRTKAGIALAALSAAGGAGTYGSFRMLQHLMGRDDSLKPGSGAYWKQYYEGMAILAVEQAEQLRITSEDGLSLVGSLYRNQKHNKRVVIACHGYHSGGYLDLAKYTSMYKAENFDILFISQRAHEGSEGRYLTFGVKEKRDIIGWCRKIIDIYGNDVRILLHGVSMGAASVLMAAGEADLPAQVRALVSDCAYASMEKEIAAVMEKYPKFVTNAFGRFMEFLADHFVDMSFYEASPENAVKNARIPALLVHGTKDRFVPFSMIGPIADNYAGEKEVFVVPEARHANSYTIDKAGYEKRFSELVQRTFVE